MSPRVQTSTGGYLLLAGRAKPFRSAGGRLIVSSWWQPVRGLRALDWSRCEAFPDYVRDQYGHLDVLANDIWTATSACSIRWPTPEFLSVTGCRDIFAPGGAV